MVLSNLFSMLKSLFIKNFILIEQLDLDFSQGFHVFTGETGAGKSIIVGALSLLLGNRADFSVIRNKQKKCEISALFSLAQNSAAKEWLHKLEIEHDNEIEIRRIISADGRSKSWLNSRPCTNTSLKQLGRLLVQIHGQHEQIKLNNAAYQLAVIDESGDYAELLGQLKSLAIDYKTCKRQLQELKNAGALDAAQSQLLQYQFEELSQLDLGENEIDHLHNQQKVLTNAVNTLENMEKSIDLLSGNSNNICQVVAEITTSLSAIEGIDLKDTLGMLEEVSINLNEIESEIQAKYSCVEVNPEKLVQVENRLDTIYTTARKHQVNAQELFQHKKELENKLKLNANQKSQRQSLLTELEAISQTYAKVSANISQKRQKTAQYFSKKVTDCIVQLGLNHAVFQVKIQHNPDKEIAELGQDSCQFEIVMNPGQEPQIMAKTASGGELSRIALAIEICKKQDNTSSSFVFDEVDAGIGGAVAETVGKLMRKLAKKQQVFAVTHLPQVAGLAHQHFLVSKSEQAGVTSSQVNRLNYQQRIKELARMSGGSKITETTLKQAESFMVKH